MASRKDVFLREVVQRCGRAPRALPRRTLPEHFASAADSTVKSLLLSIQGACSQFRQLGDKVGQRGIPGSEQSSMVRHHSLCMNVAQQLRLPEINIGVSILIRAVDASANGDENTGPRTMLDAGDCVAVTAVAAAEPRGGNRSLLRKAAAAARAPPLLRGLLRTPKALQF